MTGAFHFLNEFDADSELSRAARPVLDRLAETLQDMGTAIFLADRSGQIVARRVAGHSERVRFDKANAAEGFDFSEESIGTNGLGTPMQEGPPCSCAVPSTSTRPWRASPARGSGSGIPSPGG